MEFRKPAARSVSFSLALIAMLQFSLFGPAVGNINADDENRHKTVTPIKHVIIIIGENRTFDHIFRHLQAQGRRKREQPAFRGDHQGRRHAWGRIISRAHQFSADVTGSPVFELSPTTGKSLYSPLPAPLNGGPTDVCKDNGMCSLGDATSSEDGLATTPINYYEFLTSGGTGLSGKVPDTRINGVHSSSPYSSLAAGSLPAHKRQKPSR